MTASLDIHHPIESLGLVKASRGDIRIEEVQDRLSPKVPFPHRHDFYQIVFISEGSGWHQIDFQKYKIEKNQCFTVHPGQVHSWQLSSKTKGYILEFTVESLTEKRSSQFSLLSSLPDSLVLKNKVDSAKFLSVFSFMSQEASDKASSYQESLRSFLKILLIEIHRCCQRKILFEEKTESTVEQYRKLIDENFREHHGVEFYSQRMGLNSKALTMRIRRATRRSARDFIQERILLEAKRLLVYSEKSVSQVSDEIGYSDPNYFVRFFRQQTGQTPLKFRQSQRSRLQA